MLQQVLLGRYFNHSDLKQILVLTQQRLNDSTAEKHVGFEREKTQLFIRKGTQRESHGDEAKQQIS